MTTSTPCAPTAAMPLATAALIPAGGSLSGATSAPCSRANAATSASDVTITTRSENAVAAKSTSLSIAA